MAFSRRVVNGMLVFVMLFSGACLTLNQKLQYQTSAVGLAGEHAFEKPWFCTFLMFVGEGMALLVFGVQRVVDPEEKKCELSWWGLLWRCAFPAIFDMVATGFGSVGLTYITASTCQMLRGCAILFTAIISRFWLQRVLDFRQVVGLCMVFAAMALVGAAGAMTGGHGDQAASSIDGNGAWGVLLVCFAQLFQASQFVWEEKVMKKVCIPPLLLLGIEGIVGIILFGILVFPLLLHLPGNDVGGSLENVWDALSMVQRSPELMFLAIMYVTCVCALNCCAVYVTKFLSGVHRALIQTGLRTMVIWVVGLILYYRTNGIYGEPWAGVPSYMELFGFAFFLCGSMLHSKMIHLPCMGEPTDEYKKLPA